jgi:hypothetical protein
MYPVSVQCGLSLQFPLPFISYGLFEIYEAELCAFSAGHHADDVLLTSSASGVTSKAANEGHFKTGQRKWPGTRLFYSAS